MAIRQKTWAVEYPWIDYTTKLPARYSNKRWCIFPLGSLGLSKVLPVANKSRYDYYRYWVRQKNTMNITLSRKEETIRLQYLKAFA